MGQRTDQSDLTVLLGGFEGSLEAIVKCQIMFYCVIHPQSIQRDGFIHL